MLENDIYSAIDGEETIAEKEYTNEEIVDIKMNRIEFDGVVFSKCRFVNCDFTGSSFLNVTFLNCDLSNCRFQDCYFRDTKLNECKGDGSNFSQSSLHRVIIESGSFHYSNFTNTLSDNFCMYNVDFCDSAFQEMKIKKIIFHTVNLSRCDFFKTKLKGVDLSTCTLEGITVSDTFKELQGAKINPIQAMDIVQLLGLKIV